MYKEVHKKQTPKAIGTAYEENSDSEVNTKGDFDDVYKEVHEKKSPK